MRFVAPGLESRYQRVSTFKIYATAALTRNQYTLTG
jgi:hypothetical protein